MVPSAAAAVFWKKGGLWAVLLFFLAACGERSQSAAPQKADPLALPDKPSFNTLRSEGKKTPVDREIPVKNPPARTPSPEFQLKDLQGRATSLKDYKGKVIVLDFWATWCPPCRISMPALESLHRAYKGKPVQFLGLNLDESADGVAAFVKKRGLTYPMLVAGESSVSEAYAVDGIPAIVIIDAQGGFVRKLAGWSDDYNDEIRFTIDALLKEKA